ncbi:hypothetical protein QUB68_09925 [Microcoleus sp. A006_D1]|uniref:hypothetical protein n=1 Tax=Microcoleus sp. A006_D1 TaxID=3055267 RepID=UPI002FD45DFE
MYLNVRLADRNFLPSAASVLKRSYPVGNRPSFHKSPSPDAAVSPIARTQSRSSGALNVLRSGLFNLRSNFEASPCKAANAIEISRSL